jgi:hypothetical protein
MTLLETKNFENLPGHIGLLFVNTLNNAIKDGYVFSNKEINTAYESITLSISMRRQELIDSVSDKDQHWFLLCSIFQPHLDKLFQK